MKKYLPDRRGVVTKSSLFLQLKLPLLLLLLLLRFNYAKECIALGFGLLSHTDLVFKELLSSCVVKILRHLLSLFDVGLLLLSKGAFSFFKSTLGSEGVDLRLTVSCLLL